MMPFIIGCVAGFVAGVICFDCFVKAVGYKEAVKEMDLNIMREERDRNEF